MNSWNIQAAADLNHPNRLPFKGVLTVIDTASDLAPSGARGHRCILTKEAAEASLHTLIGMGVDMKVTWDGHDARRKVGIITNAWITGFKLKVEGYLFAKDFPELKGHLEHEDTEPMGMSYELHDAHVVDIRAQVWKLTRATFTGAAILYRSKAAYRATSFELKGTTSKPSRTSGRSSSSISRKATRTLASTGSCPFSRLSLPASTEQ